MQLEKILFQLPAVKEFLEANAHWLPQPHRALLMSLLKAYREWGGEEDKPRIAIVDWEGVPTSSEFRILKDYFVAQGLLHSSSACDEGRAIGSAAVRMSRTRRQIGSVELRLLST